MIGIYDSVQTLNRAIGTFGKEAQVDVAIEEMSELTKALLKERRNGGGETELKNIAEEIADVQIMLYQMILIFKNAEYVEKETNFKLERLRKRLDERRVE